MFKVSYFKYYACVLLVIIFLSFSMDRPPQWWQLAKDIKHLGYQGATYLGLMSENPYSHLESIQTDSKKELLALLVEYIAEYLADPSAQSKQKQDKIDEIITLIQQEPTLLQQEIRKKATLLMILPLDGLEPLAERLFNSSIDLNVNTQNSEGRTALSFASQKGRIRLMQQLFARGANVDSQDISGATALMDAITTNVINNESLRLEAIKILLDAGADTAVKNKQGQTAFDLAANNPQILELLNKYKKEKIN